MVTIVLMEDSDTKLSITLDSDDLKIQTHDHMINNNDSGSSVQAVGIEQLIEYFKRKKDVKCNSLHED